MSFKAHWPSVPSRGSFRRLARRGEPVRTASGQPVPLYPRILVHFGSDSGSSSNLAGRISPRIPISHLAFSAPLPVSRRSFRQILHLNLSNNTARFIS